MSAAITTPWGRFPLPAPLPAGPSRFHLRAAGTCAAEASVPGEATSSLISSGTDQFNGEGDLVDLPPFNRAASSRFVSARSRVAGRESVPSGVLPLPQAPP